MFPSRYPLNTTQISLTVFLRSILFGASIITGTCIACILNNKALLQLFVIEFFYMINSAVCFSDSFLCLLFMHQRYKVSFVAISYITCWWVVWLFTHPLLLYNQGFHLWPIISSFHRPSSQWLRVWDRCPSKILLFTYWRHTINSDVTLSQVQ